MTDDPYYVIGFMSQLLINITEAETKPEADEIARRGINMALKSGIAYPSELRYSMQQASGRPTSTPRARARKATTRREEVVA